MFLVVIWIGLAGAVGALAANRDRSGIGWFLLAVILSPLIAAIFLLLAGEGHTARCPFCAEKIKAAAKVCPHCRGDLQPLPLHLEGRAK